MKKFEVFIRKSQARKWCLGAVVLDTDSHNVARAMSARFSGYWIKVLPAIIIL